MGLVLVVISSAIGGTVQGILLDSLNVPFSASYIGALPWRCITAIGWSFLLFAQVVFAIHVLSLWWQKRRFSNEE
jgi:hypothetical protein